MKGWVIALVILVAVGYVYYYHPSMITGLFSGFHVAKFETDASMPAYEFGNTPFDTGCQQYCARLCASDNMVYAFSNVKSTNTTDAYNNQIIVCGCGCN